MYKVTKDIESLRAKLMRLILHKDDLLDPDVILLSKKLDKLLCKYYRIRSFSRPKYRECSELSVKLYSEI